MSMSNFGDMRRLIRSVDAMRNHLGLRNVAAPYDGHMMDEALVPSVYTFPSFFPFFCAVAVELFMLCLI
jgi:hypothetical protein